MTQHPLHHPHRMPGDTPPAPTPSQRALNVEVLVDEHGKRIVHLESHLPGRGVERTMLGLILVILALIFGALMGLVDVAYQIVGALPR